MTDHDEYAEMVRSFQAGGFHGDDCEYLYLDNSHGNAFDAFQGGNIFLREAAGEIIILCHQDVLLLNDDRRTLETRLAELQALSPDWALCGNGGGTPSGELVIRVSDPHGEDQSLGSFPTLATALDENFIVVRREANLALSHDLTGFHLYGADLCILADVLGWSAWVIDFHLRHKSAGQYSPAFFEAVTAVREKYRRAFRTRQVTTTCVEFKLREAKFQRLLPPLFRAR
ncbi:hypothetical protein [Sphingomonas agri]|uniref:hypothetical protein n=1 Tax=Sphingomonas agri TaxID=1813878 RepID=UPI00311EE801